MKLELWYPIKGWSVTQRFGENQVDFYKKLGMRGHNGIDVLADNGQVIRAAHDGEVTFTGEDGSGGLGVVIRTLEKYEYAGQPNADIAYYKTIYWHCKPNTFRVKPGDKVRVGDAIAEADNTGLSTGSHLHFALKPVFKGEADWSWYNAEQDNGYFGAVDPEPFFNGQYAEAGGAMYAIIDIAKKVVALLTNLLKR